MQKHIQKPVFDPSIYRLWQETEPSTWKTIVLDLVESFEPTATPYVARLKTAIHEDNVKGIESAAHNLKIACANVGALRAHGFFEEMEFWASHGKCKTTTELISQIDQLFAQTISALSAYMETLKA